VSKQRELVGRPWLKDAFVSSITMILVSEMGDETFIIAAIMAMRHPRLIVLLGRPPHLDCLLVVYRCA